MRTTVEVRWKVARFVALAALPAFLCADSWGGNIATADKHAWASQTGWQNFGPTHGGVTVVRNGANGYLSGYAWAGNVGWIKLGDGVGPYGNSGPSDWGVNMDAGGNLSGYAWSKHVGWVNFHPSHGQVTVDPVTGRFDGYAWAENMGWVHFRNASPAYNVKTTFVLGNIDSANAYAWSSHTGWQNFSPTHGQVTIDTGTGRFDGFAWAENIGWIHFQNASPVYNVRTTAFDAPPVLGPTVFRFR